MILDFNKIITKSGLYHEKDQIFVLIQWNFSQSEIWLESELFSLNEFKF